MLNIVREKKKTVFMLKEYRVFPVTENYHEYNDAYVSPFII